MSLPYAHYIVIDTETNGMPEGFDASLEQTERWPEVLQLAWLVLDQEGNLVKEENHYLKNKNVKLDKNAQQLHGITKDLLKKKGVSKRGIIKRLRKDIHRYDALVVGHFIEFDLKMLSVEINRLNLHIDFRGLPTFCTMLMSGMKSFHPEATSELIRTIRKILFKKVRKYTRREG